MRLLSRIHHVDTAEYLVRTSACYNCIRFYKVPLKEKSAIFRWLHRWINPVFDYVIEKIVTVEERQKARQYAQAATQGNLSEDEANDWMRNMKTGF